MKKSKLLLSIGTVLLLMAGGCKDEPDEHPDWCLDKSYKVPVMVHVNVDPAFSDYTSVDSTMMEPKTRQTRGDPSWQLQYHVAAYEKGKTTPTDVFYSDENPVKTNLHPGKYTLVGWASYSPSASSKGHYFNMDDFSELMLKHKYDYTGNDPWKVPYHGTKETSIAYTTSVDSVPVKAAMAQYKIIATDTAKFIPKKAVISYSSVPAAINGLTGKINYQWNDIEFESEIKNNVLATDYVLSDTKETSVNANIEIYDENNNLCARTLNLRIPLKNGGLTTIRGNFYSILDLTGLDSGGIVIDTEYEATFEIEI